MPITAFVGSINTRGPNQSVKFTTFDQLFQNCVFLPVKNEIERKLTIYVEKRFGFKDAGDAWAAIANPQLAFGWVGANSGADVLAISGQNAGVTRVGYYSGAFTTIKTHADNSIVWFFTQTTDSSMVPFLTWGRANAEYWGYAFGGVAAQITVPSGSVGPMQHMDGWTFVATANPARIYNSNLNDPTTGYTSFISAQISPDRLVTCFKYGSYILGMGTNGIEWFYNAGNPAGSPLSSIKEKYIKGVGLFAPDSITEGPDGVYFLSRGSDTGAGAYRLTASGLTKISGPIEDRIFNGLTTQASASLPNVAKVKYLTVLGIKIVMFAFVSSNTALVYFPDAALWSYWITGNGTAGQLFYTLTPTESAVNGYILTPNSVRSSIVVDNVEPSAYNDVGVAITRIIRTSVLNYGTGKRKIDEFIRIIGDKAPSSLPISVQTTDDDYATLTTARPIDMASEDPCAYQWGTFRRRAYVFTDTASLGGRVVGFETEPQKLPT